MGPGLRQKPAQASIFPPFLEGVVIPASRLGGRRTSNERRARDVVVASVGSAMFFRGQLAVSLPSRCDRPAAGRQALAWETHLRLAHNIVPLRRAKSPHPFGQFKGRRRIIPDASMARSHNERRASLPLSTATVLGVRRVLCWHFPQFIALICPPHHHADALVPIVGASVGAADGVAFDMGQLSLDSVGTP